MASLAHWTAPVASRRAIVSAELVIQQGHPAGRDDNEQRLGWYVVDTHTGRAVSEACTSPLAAERQKAIILGDLVDVRC